jgi:hypothetical protein
MRIRNPEVPDSPWIALEVPDMPRFKRNRNAPKYRRERPVYVVHLDGLIIVE